MKKWNTIAWASVMLLTGAARPPVEASRPVEAPRPAAAVAPSRSGVATRLNQAGDVLGADRPVSILPGMPLPGFDEPKSAVPVEKPVANPQAAENTEKESTSAAPTPTSSDPADSPAAPPAVAEDPVAQPDMAATEPGAPTPPSKLNPESARPLLPPGRGASVLPTTTPAARTTYPRTSDPLDAAVDQAIDLTARRVLATETHTPWQIGHGLLAFRRDYVLRKDGEKVNALDWVATNPSFPCHVSGPNGTTIAKNLPWFYLTPHGARPQKFTGTPYEYEGHPNQFLAFFALSRLPLDFPFQIEGKTVTFGEMLTNAKMEVTDKEEITWTLWAFAYYYDMNDQWINAAGEPWSIERLVSTQLRQPVEKSPCGGCHGLFALASARNAYLQAGNRLSGVWMQTHMHLTKYIELARAQQNRDGSFSSNYFKGPGYIADPSKRVSTTGHTLEFLMMALPQNRLQEPWVRSAVAAVARDLTNYKAEPLEVGGMYHAAHALVLYRERTRQQVAMSPTAVRPMSASAEQQREVR